MTNHCSSGRKPKAQRSRAIFMASWRKPPSGRAHSTMRKSRFCRGGCECVVKHRLTDAIPGTCSQADSSLFPIMGKERAGRVLPDSLRHHGTLCWVVEACAGIVSTSDQNPHRKLLE